MPGLQASAPYPRHVLLLMVCVMTTVSATTLLAQETGVKQIELRGLFESAAAVELSDGKLQKWDFLLKPELTVDLNDNLRLTALGHLRFDPIDKLEPGRPRSLNDNRSPLSRRYFTSDYDDLELRELYLDTSIGSSLLRVGKQQTVWGQADGLRVLDIVNPFDFREFILPDFEDRRIPLWTLSIEAPVGPIASQFIWIPDQTYDQPPQANGTFAFTSPLVVPAAPPGVPVTVEPPNRPNRTVADSDIGGRVSAFLGGWDLTLNYLYHYHDQAVLYQTRDAGGITITPRYERTHLVGGTFANAFGDFTLRGELGYSTDRFFLSNDPDDSDGIAQSGELGYVAALDYSVDADLLISSQFFQSLLTEYDTGFLRDRVESQATLRLDQQFLNDRGRASLLIIQSLNDGDGVLQADLNYEWRSDVILKFGADLFYGDRSGLFGQFQDATRLTFGVEFGF